MKSAYQNEIEKISAVKPSMSYDGSEVTVWQEKARKKLSELIGLDRFTKVAPETEIEYVRQEKGFTETRFTFATEEGYRVPAHLLIPEGAKKPPLIITLQGHATGMHISLGRAKYNGDEGTIKFGDRDFAIRAVKEGYAALALEQRDFGECGEKKGGTDCLDAALTALIGGRTIIGERVWDVMRAIDLIESEFSELVDTEKICCMGNSGGGTATVYISALEPRIALEVPSCAMCTYKNSIIEIKHCACNYIPHIAQYFDMGDLMAMAAPKYFVQVSGARDTIFPIEGAKKVFNAGKATYEKLGAADKCELVIGDGEHRFYADDAWKIIHKMMGI